MLYRSTEAEFLRMSTATNKIQDLSCTCKHLPSSMSKHNGQMKRIKFSLIKII